MLDGGTTCISCELAYSELYMLNSRHSSTTHSCQNKNLLWEVKQLSPRVRRLPSLLSHSRMICAQTCFAQCKDGVSERNLQWCDVAVSIVTACNLSNNVFLSDLTFLFSGVLFLQERVFGKEYKRRKREQFRRSGELSAICFTGKSEYLHKSKTQLRTWWAISTYICVWCWQTNSNPALRCNENTVHLKKRVKSFKRLPEAEERRM